MPQPSWKWDVQCYPEVLDWQVYNVLTCILQWLLTLTLLQKSAGNTTLKFVVEKSTKSKQNFTRKMTKPPFMQQKKLFIWDTHCQYKLRDHKTYTFQLFFSTENKFWIGIKKTIVFHLIPFYIRRDLKS